MNKNEKIINISLVLLSGISFFLAGLIIPFFIWFAFIPLIILAQRVENKKENFVYALVASVLIALGIFYWSFNYRLVYAFLLILYVASFFFIYEVLLFFVFSKIKNSLSIFAPSILWIFLFWIYSHFGFGSFWLNPAVFQVKFSFINQFLGELGFIFLIILFNTLLAYVILKEHKAPYIIPVIFISLLLLPAYYYGQNKVVEGRRVRVAVIQGNFMESIDWRKENAANLILDDYIEQTRKVAQERPDLVVWPEYAIPADLLIDQQTYNKIASLAKELNVNLIMGALIKGKELKNTDFQYDSAFAFDRMGNLIDRYDSLEPFPIGAKNIPGERYVILDTDAGRIALTICFDEVFNNIYKEYDRLGADYFVSLSNNAPIRSFLGMKLTKRFSELRASTYNKYFVRATNSGFSEIIDPFGNVINKIPFEEKGYMISDIYIK